MKSARALFLSLAAALTCLVGTVHAQSNTSNTWDANDPADMAESREYFLRWWIGHDAGDESVLLGDFTFTHSPDTTYALLVPALHLFEKLYSDRLSLSDPFSTTYYSVFDLIRDDPSVMARFREYTISGNVVTDSAMDASAY